MWQPERAQKHGMNNFLLCTESCSLETWIHVSYIMTEVPELPFLLSYLLHDLIWVPLTFHNQASWGALLHSAAEHGSPLFPLPVVCRALIMVSEQCSGRCQGRRGPLYWGAVQMQWKRTVLPPNSLQFKYKTTGRKGEFKEKTSPMKLRHSF